MKRALVFLNSHPIQYFAPLYREIEKSDFYDFEVWYCSKHGLEAEFDRQFGTSVKWDIPILEGYRHRFLRNRSPRPSIYGFWGLVNLALIKQLWRLPRQSIVVVHGWAYFSHWLCCFFAWLFGHSLCIRGESPLSHESSRLGLVSNLRKFLLRYGLFRLAGRFLFIGNQNRLFYQHYGIRDNKLLFTPYSVDNERFQHDAKALLPQKKSLRRQIGLTEGAFVILFTGKFIDKKHPLDLLSAIAKIPDTQVMAVFVGEGVLRPEMEAFILDNNLQERVILTGFINQSVISRYYAASDIFVMCSGIGETWGLAVNEAMNFSLPVIVSDLAGCSDDLVEENKNGFTYPCGDSQYLANKIGLIITMSDAERTKLGAFSRNRIDGYSYQAIISGLKKI